MNGLKRYDGYAYLDFYILYRRAFFVLPSFRFQRRRALEANRLCVVCFFLRSVFGSYFSNVRRTKMIDNLELILPLLKFDSEDDFYFLQILQRGKENEGLGRNSRVVKNYIIRNPEYLQERYDQIKKLCEVFNARACLRLNRRSFRKVAFKAMVNLANQMSNAEYSHCGKAYDSAMGQSSNEPVKRWIIDVDTPDTSGQVRNFLQEVVNEVMPDAFEKDKHIITLPSKSGWHVITTPFNVTHFTGKLGSTVKPYVEIHKDNPTNLYIP